MMRAEQAPTSGESRGDASLPSPATGRLLLAEISRLLPGLYAWLATVLSPALQRGASNTARVFALLALLAALGSFALAARRPRLARVLGVYGFMACCFGAWAWLGPLLRSDQLDSVRGSLGALGFLLHALAWGAPAQEPEPASGDNLVPGSPLEPRQKPVRFGMFVLAFGIAVALLPVASAFGVERPSTALLAHALALGCGVLVIGASSAVALRVGKPHPLPGWRSRAARSLWAMGWLIALGALGLLWLALR